MQLPGHALPFLKYRESLLLVQNLLGPFLYPFLQFVCPGLKLVLRPAQASRHLIELIVQFFDLVPGLDHDLVIKMSCTDNAYPFPQELNGLQQARGQVACEPGRGNDRGDQQSDQDDESAIKPGRARQLIVED